MMINRVIKFRAWDGGRMTTAGVTFNSSSGELSAKLYAADGDDVEMPVMQFTGLRDKNDVEIYEGDIVKWDDCSNGKYWRVAIVDMSPDAAGLGFKCFDCPTIENSSAHGHTFKYGSFIYTDTENHLEVIGNVYENPELLGDV